MLTDTDHSPIPSSVTTMLDSKASLILSALLAMAAGTALAEEDTGQKTAYIDMNPAFVLNYGDKPGEKVRFLKAEVALRTDTTDAAALVEKHMPLLRNELVLLFSGQTERSLSSSAAKDALRLTALERANDVLQAETGQEPIVDLLFNSFIVQK